MFKGHLRLVCVLFERATFKCFRYFDGNLDKLFSECHVINPSKKPKTRLMSTRSSSLDLPCQICYLNYPNSVSVTCSWLMLNLHQFLRKACVNKNWSPLKWLSLHNSGDLFGRNVFLFLVFHRSWMWTQVLYTVLGRLLNHQNHWGRDGTGGLLFSSLLSDVTIRFPS